MNTTYKGFTITLPSLWASVNRFGWNAVVWKDNEQIYKVSGVNPDVMLENAKNWIDLHF